MSNFIRLFDCVSTENVYEEKLNHLNLSADVLLISVSVTFADGVQPLELGDRPTNYFGSQRFKQRYTFLKENKRTIILVIKMQRYKKSIGDILHRLISSVTHCLF